MESGRAVLFVAIVMVLTLSVSPGFPAEKDAGEKAKEEKKAPESIWTEEEEAGRRRFEPTEEEIERIVKSVKESDPAKAKELEELRKTDTSRFLNQLREYGKEEFAKIIKERIDGWRAQRVAEFLDWLGREYEPEAKELAGLKTKDPNLYNKKYELVWDKYRAIYEAWRRNPELGKVLKQDSALRTRCDELIAKIKSEKDDKKRAELGKHLYEVVADRFDLIVRRRQIAYEELLRRLKEMQDQINEQKNEISRWRNEKFKEENVRQRIKELTEGIPKFNWN
jgi:hypothetical protein